MQKYHEQDQTCHEQYISLQLQNSKIYWVVGRVIGSLLGQHRRNARCCLLSCIVNPTSYHVDFLTRNRMVRPKWKGVRIEQNESRSGISIFEFLAQSHERTISCRTLVPFVIDFFISTWCEKISNQVSHVSRASSSIASRTVPFTEATVLRLHSTRRIRVPILFSSKTLCRHDIGFEQSSKN